MKRTLLISIFVAAAAHRASADCTITMSASVKQYWPASGTTSWAGDDRCDNVKAGTSCHLSGWLYQPSGSGKHPAIVYSTNAPQTGSRFDTCEVVNYFVPKGYVVFVPYARGTDDVSPHSATAPGEGFHNTGTNHLDTGSGSSLDQLEADDEEAYDLQLAFQSVQAMSNVDPNKVAVFGAGDGGTRAAFLAETPLSTPNPAVTINLSGAVWTWSGDPQWAADLEPAAEYHITPVLYQAVANESSSGTYTATLDQFTAAGQDNGSRPAKLALYAAYTISSSAQAICTAKSYNANRCASYTFVTDAAQVARWIDVVHDYLVQYGVT